MTYEENSPMAYEVNTSLRPATLRGFSAEQIAQHWQLYEGYVKQVNAPSVLSRKCTEKIDMLIAASCTLTLPSAALNRYAGEDSWRAVQWFGSRAVSSPARLFRAGEGRVRVQVGPLIIAVNF